MWVPQKRYASSSEDEKNACLNAICALEFLIQDSTKSNAQSGRAFAQLSQQLEQRRAWLTPVRRLPNEVLSMVIIATCEQDWKAPRVFALVCRLWRECLLATSRVWTFIPICTYQSRESVSLLLSRNTRSPLHIKLLGQPQAGRLDVISPESGRIQCLTLDQHHFELLRNPLRKLRKLAISGSGDGQGIVEGIFDRFKFPNLRSLRINFLLDSISRRVLSFTALPPLQELSFSSCAPEIWVHILELCAKSLVSLTARVGTGLSRISSIPQARTTIHFPNLLYLHVDAWSFGPVEASWPLEAITPRLQSYDHGNTRSSSPIHRDTSTVRFLHTLHEVNLVFFPNVANVYLESGILSRFLRSFEEHQPRCPSLMQIVYDPPLSAGFMTALRPNLDRLDRQCGRHIVVTAERFQPGVHLPGSMEDTVRSLAKSILFTYSTSSVQDHFCARRHIPRALIPIEDHKATGKLVSPTKNVI